MKRRRRRAGRAMLRPMRPALLALAIALLAACGCARPSAGAPRRPLASNVLRADYAGSRECGECHGQIAAAFARSPMHNMTRAAEGALIRAPAEASFTFKGQTATFTVEHGARHLRFGGHDFTITQVIGGRTREDFVGREPGGEEEVLPVSYVFTTGAFRYKGYSVMLPERDHLVAGPVWSKTCIFCHNTVPLLATLYDDLGGDPRHGYQGSPTDRLLPDDKVWRLEVTDAARLAGAVGDELARLGAPRPTADEPLARLLTRAIDTTRHRFGAKDFVELGIGCEACHLGARAHAADPEVRPSLLPESDLFAARPPTPPTHAEVVNHTCLRCHTVLFSGYPYTWEGGRRASNPGGSSINSGEARDFLLGGCSGKLACTACHDPHGAADRSKLEAVANAVCTTCHARYAEPAARAAHTHHRPDGPGAACLACHMPKKNLGLALEVTRYHRIGSPTDEARVLADRPLECALCHVDQSVGALAADLERWWGKRYPSERLASLYGSLDANVIGATLARGLAHEQAAAAGALGAARVRPDELVPLLTHPIPLLRHLARRQLEHITGRDLSGLDLDAPAATIEAAARAALSNPAVTSPAVTNPAVTSPAVTTPALTNPAVTSPAVTNPAVTNPAVTNPD
jgi:predicted CXXCH cytochrome family protein